MNEIIEVVGPILKAMPPWLAGVVIIAMSIAAVIYAYRRAGEEAKTERAKFDGGVHSRLDVINKSVEAINDKIDLIHTGIEVLKDRGGRK